MMATRPVYLPCDKIPYYKVFQADFIWNSGFAPSQKQKNIRAVHETFLRQFPNQTVLEISSKSMQEEGTTFSAFSLSKFVPSLVRAVLVENIFQSSKLFENGGPYSDSLFTSPREAKRDERLRTSGKLIGFYFESMNFPSEPKTIFYDYIYLNALLENEYLSQLVLSYDAFTDLEFNQNKSINCQSKAAALFVSLHRLGLTDCIRDFKSFLKLYTEEE